MCAGRHPLDTGCARSWGSCQWRWLRRAPRVHDGRRAGSQPFLGAGRLFQGLAFLTEGWIFSSRNTTYFWALRSAPHSFSPFSIKLQIMFQTWGKIKTTAGTPPHCSKVSQKPHLPHRQVLPVFESKNCLRSKGIHLKILAAFGKKKNNSCSFKVGFSFFLGWVETRNFTVILWCDTLIQINYPGLRNKAKNSCSPYQSYNRALSKKRCAWRLLDSLGSVPCLFTNDIWLEPTFCEVTC